MDEWYETQSSLYHKCITQTKNGMITSVYIINEILSKKWYSYVSTIIDQKFFRMNGHLDSGADLNCKMKEQYLQNILKNYTSS